MKGVLVVLFFVPMLLLWWHLERDRNRTQKAARDARIQAARGRATNKHVLVSDDVEWIYEKAPRSDAKVQLLTIGNIQTTGYWHGEVGEFFKAWQHVPKRNKQRERELGLLPPERAITQETP